MSSATSIEAPQSDPGLRPWQFFVLAGMLAATAVVIVATGQSAASIIILSLTVVATSLVAIGAYRALSPLTRSETADAPTVVGGRTRAALEREKILVLRSIKELEFDYAMKKITKSDFDEMSTRLRARAMGLMRQIDAGGYTNVIEQELNARLGLPATARLDDTARATAGAGGAARATGVKHTDIGEERDFPVLPALSERERVEGSPADEDTGGGRDFSPAVLAAACVACGVINDPDALFCKRCGSRIAD